MPSISPGGIAIQHKYLSEVRSRGAKQIQTIGFGLRERLFVPEDDACGVVLNLAKRDESATFQLSLPARDGEPLNV
jgi:hypothetical protein